MTKNQGQDHQVKKNQGQDHQVKKNQDQNLLLKKKMKKKRNVRSLAPDHDLSLVLSQDLVLANVHHQEVGLDLRVLNGTVDIFYFTFTLVIFYCKDRNSITQIKAYKESILFMKSSSFWFLQIMNF